jgi:hypothetical protein
MTTQGLCDVESQVTEVVWQPPNPSRPPFNRGRRIITKRQTKDEKLNVNEFEKTALLLYSTIDGVLGIPEINRIGMVYEFDIPVPVSSALRDYISLSYFHSTCGWPKTRDSPRLELTTSICVLIIEQRISKGLSKSSSSLIIPPGRSACLITIFSLTGFPDHSTCFRI